MNNIRYILLAFFIAFPAILKADFYNNRNVIVGDRAALMGGAFTAISSDVSGSYYNPAGLAAINSTTMSINASIYRYQDASLEIKQESPVQFKLEHNNKNLIFLPSSFGAAFKPNDNVTAAFSIYQIDRFNVSNLGEVEYTTEKSAAKFELDSVSYLIGPSAAYSISERFSIGVSCFYHYSNAEYTFAMGLPLNNTSNVIVTTRSGGVTGILGIKTTPVQSTSIGLSYGTETINLNGENRYSYTDTSAPANNVFAKNNGDIRLPHRLNGGIAYEKSSYFTLSMDIVYYFPMDYAAPYEISSNTDHINNHHKERGHADISLGAEIYLSEKFSLRTGLYSNTSGATEQNSQSKINQYGGTLGVSMKSGDTVTSVGTNVMYGKTDYTKDHSLPVISSESRWERLTMSIVVGATTKL